MEHGHFVELGRRVIRGYETPFGIFGTDRRRHVYTIGKTGVGKSTLLRNMIVQDIEAGCGVGLIDPHGDLAEEILDLIPSRRMRDVVYFNPHDREYPIGLNLLRSSQGEHRERVVSEIVSAFKSVWGEFWGPRMQHILAASIAALSECENTSILGIQRILTDEQYRWSIVRNVTDPMVRHFWMHEFPRYGRNTAEVIGPIQNKVGQLVMSSVSRNILGQVSNALDARFIMDNQRIFIANLSKGRLGEGVSNLLGAMLVAQFQSAAMARADIPQGERKDFFLAIDEFQNFATDAFAGILSEARKYRLCLTLSHQYIEQLRPEIRAAVFGNVGSVISFQVGEADAAALERSFGSAYSAQHLTELSNFEVCGKLLTHGESGEAFTGKTLPPMGERYGKGKRIVRQSQKRYGTERHIIEQKIERWLTI
jgi:hypothetical protein